MPILDLEQLMQPVSPDQPCGEDLEYDGAFIAVDTASRGKPEQQYGDTLIEAEPPDWAEVVRMGISLMERTKDLRVACLVARGLLELRGIPAFCEGLQLIQGYVEQHWDGIHPRLDPDDGNDPTLRINTLESLNDYSSTVMSLRRNTLVDGGVLGKFSLQDIEIAKGHLPPHAEDGAPPTEANINAAFQQAGIDALKLTLDGVQASHDAIRAIDSCVTEQVGAAAAAAFTNLTEAMGKIRSYLATEAEQMGFSEQAPTSDEESSDDESGESGESAAAATTRAAPLGEIRSRDDVLKTLDRLCRYYEQYEPSSPLPLLLRRAQRLATMSFLDIVQELTPEGLMQAKSIGGVREEE